MSGPCFYNPLPPVVCVYVLFFREPLSQILTSSTGHPRKRKYSLQKSNLRARPRWRSCQLSRRSAAYVPLTAGDVSPRYLLHQGTVPLTDRDVSPRYLWHQGTVPLTDRDVSPRYLWHQGTVPLTDRDVSPRYLWHQGPVPLTDMVVSPRYLWHQRTLPRL